MLEPALRTAHGALLPASIPRRAWGPGRGVMLQLESGRASIELLVGTESHLVTLRPRPRFDVPMQTQMLTPAYDIGARVSSNSWGAMRTSYTTLDRQLDTFAYDHRDMTILVAAGNCGDAISGCYSGVIVPF